MELLQHIARSQVAFQWVGVSQANNCLHFGVDAYSSVADVIQHTFVDQGQHCGEWLLCLDQLAVNLGTWPSSTSPTPLSVPTQKSPLG